MTTREEVEALSVKLQEAKERFTVLGMMNTKTDARERVSQSAEYEIQHRLVAAAQKAFDTAFDDWVDNGAPGLRRVGEQG